MDVIWESKALRLLGDMSRTGVELDRRLQDAFWSTPRHEFIDRIYVQDDSLAWIPVDRPEDYSADEHWLDTIYQDKPYVVAVDSFSYPTSSNSVPSLVYRLLGLLNLRPGSTVLEIGTGTGYLTELLRKLVGPDGAVDSVEVDSLLARTAEARLKARSTATSVRVIHDDAAAFTPKPRSYDLVVSTARARQIPRPWLDSLKSTGKVCVDLGADIASAQLLAQASSGTRTMVSGRFLDFRSNFMPLRSSDEDEARFALPPGFATIPVKTIPADGLGLKQILETNFRWYCQLELPTARVSLGMRIEGRGSMGPFLMDDDAYDSVLLPRDGSVTDAQLQAYGGSSYLIERLTAAWESWQSLGCPTPGKFSFDVQDDYRQRVVLASAAKSWYL
jgi:protein-L-isoaspartate O-methyltransferase